MWPDAAEHGMAGMAGHDGARQSLVWSGLDGQARPCLVGLGSELLGMAWIGRAWQVRSGTVRRDVARRGQAGQGRQGTAWIGGQGIVVPGPAGAVGRCQAVPCNARIGSAADPKAATHYREGK